MNKNNKTMQIHDLNDGSQIRAYIFNIMNDLQTLRKNIDNLKNNNTILEMFDDKLNDANAGICGLNSLMGDIMGYTIADDIWEKQKVTHKF